MATTAATPSGLRDYFGTVRRRAIYVVVIAPSILLLSVFLAFWLTPQYQSTATILLQSSTVTKGVVETTVTSDTDEQIEIVQNRVLQPEVLAPLVRDLDPYPNDSSSTAIQKARRIIAATSIEMVDPVTFKPTSDPTNAFSLHYNNPNRVRSAAMTAGLAQLFLSSNQLQRTEDAKGTTTFLQQQAAGVAHEMSAVDAELARLKTNVGDALPELRDQNQSAIDRTEHNIDSLQQEILAAEGKESQLSVELGGMSPNLITQSGDMTDVATVRAQLEEAELRYTPEHPEVKRLKRALQALMDQTSGKVSGGIASSATNPQYVMTATELQSARRELESLQAQAAKEQRKLEGYEELLRRTPGVEREESDVLRRRQSLQAQYQQIQDKLQGAQELKVLKRNSGATAL